MPEVANQTPLQTPVGSARLPQRRQRELLNDEVNKIRSGPYQLVVLLLGGGVYCAEGSLLLIISIVAKNIISLWQLSPLTAGAMAGIVFCGLVIGTITGGIASDQYGRRLPVILTYCGVILFISLCLVTSSFLPLLGSQFMLGLFLGFGLPAANTIVVESCPSSDRSNIYSMTMVLFSLGQMYAALGLWILNPTLDEKALTWRSTLAIGLPLPCVLLVGSYFFLLESPHWLLVNGMYAEAKEVILTMARYNQADTTPVQFALSSIDADSGFCVTPAHRESESRPILHDDTTAWGRVQKLFSPQWRRLTIIMSYITFVSNFAYYGMIYGLPHTVKVLPVTGMNNMSPAAAVFFSAVFEIPGVFLAVLLGNTVGRRFNIGFDLFSTGTCLIGTIYAIFEGKMDTIGLWSTFGVKMFVAAGFIIVYLYLLECYPAGFRATGLAFCMVLGRLGAFFCPFIHDTLINLELKTAWFFLTMAALCFSCSVLCCFLPQETKDAPLPGE